ncbi:hypothetical protein JZ751_006476 [Albula glossodonta]|uniref:Uncharacterized protein n=1 Tax=Albula glossodonta TaxID=121402 RepID=A0A8T2N3P4_9TELE|nr:hypothetical protein JZ751_006476 [Albula glossodonta]
MAGLILEILEELRKEDFEKFTLYLSENVVEGCSPISWEQLEDKGVAGVVSLMRKYSGNKMLKLTLEILKKIRRHDLAQRLENDLEMRTSQQTHTDLRSASVNPSVTAEVGGNAVDYTEQAPTDLRSVPSNSSIAAQTGATVAAPQVHGCSVAGNMIVNVNIQPDNKVHGFSQLVLQQQKKLGV